MFRKFDEKNELECDDDDMKKLNNWKENENVIKIKEFNLKKGEFYDHMIYAAELVYLINGCYIAVYVDTFDRADLSTPI